MKDQKNLAKKLVVFALIFMMAASSLIIGTSADSEEPAVTNIEPYFAKITHVSNKTVTAADQGNNNFYAATWDYSRLGLIATTGAYEIAENGYGAEVI